MNYSIEVNPESNDREGVITFKSIQKNISILEDKITKEEFARKTIMSMVDKILTPIKWKLPQNSFIPHLHNISQLEKKSQAIATIDLPQE
jgi:hypothetical protein